MNFTKLTRPQLIQYCREHDIPGYSKLPKNKLIQLIQQQTPTNTPDDTPDDTPTPKILVKRRRNNQLRFIDLFAGVGGFHQALTRLGAKCVFACDIDAKCRETYYNNYGIKPHDDVRTIIPEDIPNFDIICGGFPCQPFSNAGHKGALADDRGNLFMEILRIARAKQPRFMILENVKHIKRIQNGEVFRTILQRLGDAGYHCADDETVFEISPHQLGVPQQRERVIFVCIRRDIYDAAKPILPKVPDTIPPMDFERIYENNPDPKYNISPEVNRVLTAWDQMINHVEVGQKLSPTILVHEFYRSQTPQEFSLLPDWKQEYIQKNRPIYEKYKEQWDTWQEHHRETLTRREIYGKLEWQAGPKTTRDTIFNHFIQLRQSGIRVKRSKQFPTLVAIVQTPIIGAKKRHITPRECARLQSFPDSFKLHPEDKVSYKQFGNAVNVDVIHTVADALWRAYALPRT